MEPYAKEADYTKYGSGNLKNEELKKYLELASIDINRATLTRIEKRGYNNLTKKQQDLITKATCLQADFIKEEGLYDEDDVSSFSIGGDLTINKKENQKIYEELEISKTAFFYLKKTGLTNRII